MNSEHSVCTTPVQEKSFTVLLLFKHSSAFCLITNGDPVKVDQLCTAHVFLALKKIVHCTTNGDPVKVDQLHHLALDPLYSCFDGVLYRVFFLTGTSLKGKT